MKEPDLSKIIEKIRLYFRRAEIEFKNINFSHENNLVFECFSRQGCENFLEWLRASGDQVIDYGRGIPVVPRWQCEGLTVILSPRETDSLIEFVTNSDEFTQSHDDRFAGENSELNESTSYEEKSADEAEDLSAESADELSAEAAEPAEELGSPHQRPTIWREQAPKKAKVRRSSDSDFEPDETLSSEEERDDLRPADKSG